MGFRFKVFADYEAYIKCQGQVDQLFMVRFAHCSVGILGVTGMSVLQWSPLHGHCSMWVPWGRVRQVWLLQQPHTMGF